MEPTTNEVNKLNAGFIAVFIAVLLALALIVGEKATAMPISTAAVIVLIGFSFLSYYMSKRSTRTFLSGTTTVSDWLNVVGMVGSAGLQIWAIAQSAG